MDEYSDAGMDPEMRRYFKKIMNSFGVGMLWLLSMGTSGLFFKLAFPAQSWQWYNVAFYAVFLLSLALVVRFFVRVWKNTV